MKETEQSRIKKGGWKKEMNTVIDWINTADIGLEK
jgi:hypothetical protein